MKSLDWRSLVPLLVLILILPALANQDQGKLTLPGLGFSIAPLDVSPDAGDFQALSLFLPASGGMAPNVIVNIQHFAGTMDEYLSLSKKEFEPFGFTVVRDSVAGSSAVIEYTGAFQSYQMHWYARAVQKGDVVYLVTATALASQWPVSGKQLKECVDSFETVE